MPLIGVDPGALGLSGVRLSDAVGVARDVQSHESRLTALVGQCGDRVLHDAACSFVARWSYGAGLIAEDGDRLSTMLSRAGTNYAAVDDTVAAGEA